MSERSRPTVLIVDDEEVGRLVLEGALEDQDYRLLSAANGTQALELARSHQPDVVVLDVMMPEVTGYEVCRQLRCDPNLGNVPILFLTALNGAHSRQQGLAAGADDFLSKPLDVSEFRTRIRTITQLNRFREISDGRERFETIFACSPDAIVIVDGAGAVLSANPAADALGLGLAAEMPSVLFDRFGAAEATALRALAHQALRSTQRVGPIEVERSEQPGEGRIFEVSAASLPWTWQRAAQLTVRDITEKKQMERWLMRSSRIELLGQFASEIVHDVNNLLATISFTAGHLACSSVPTVRGPAERIEQIAVRAGSVLQRVLQFARGAPEAMLDRQLEVAAGECVVMIAEALGKRIKIEYRAAPQPLPVKLDENQLHQLILNLCVNARDAMGGSGMIEVETELREVNEELTDACGQRSKPGRYGVVRVRDHGSGMTPEIAGRLFEPFFTTKPAGKGTGLGLAAVARSVQTHGGFVSVETELDAGSCFNCHFPLLA